MEDIFLDDSREKLLFMFSPAGGGKAVGVLVLTDAWTIWQRTWKRMGRVLLVEKSPVPDLTLKADGLGGTS